MAVKKYGFFAKKSSAIKINNLDDAKKYNVGGQSGGVSEDFLKSNGFKQIDLTTAPIQNLKKLNAGRFDLWYTSSTTPITIAAKAGVDMSAFKMVYVVKKSTLYIAFNKQTSDAVIKDWQKAYDEMATDGSIKKIFKEYGFESLCPNE